MAVLAPEPALGRQQASAATRDAAPLGAWPGARPARVVRAESRRADGSVQPLLLLVSHQPGHLGPIHHALREFARCCPDVVIDYADQTDVADAHFIRWFIEQGLDELTLHEWADEDAS